ncbi:MAG: EVE domain-containing protein [Methanothrix sp.]|nr:EVE domain-containing protein [Methanothrix sp.]
MSRNYWLDLYTGKTWEEFLASGGDVCAFRKSRKKIASRIHPGDYLVCYLTGISRLAGILEVKSESFYDETPIYEDDVFPVRFKVNTLYKLDLKTAIPILTLKDKLPMLQNLKSPNAWTGHFRGSPAKLSQKDGEVIVEAIRQAKEHPISLDFDEKKLAHRPRKTYKTKQGTEVTVPEPEEPARGVEAETPGQTKHEEIQYMLLKLGSDLGLDVCVARNDRNKAFMGKNFSEIPSMRGQVPRQFDEATNKTIEYIDVLWLQGDAIVAAFEVEHTTAIYSGLLRMSDLVSMQPNINLKLYLVAPDERRDKIFEEIRRPTFARLKPPLTKMCKFIAYSKLEREVIQLGPKVKFMKPEFIEEITESCED